MNTYSDYAQRYNAAYAAFREIYIQRNPPPAMPEPVASDLMTRLALVALVIASVVVSGSRTISEFAGDNPNLVQLGVGLSAFIMLEISIVVYAFIRTKNNYDQERRADVKALINRGMWLSFVIAVVANVHATAKSAGFTSEAVDLIIAIALGVSAPTLAFISGDILGMQMVTEANANRKQQVMYFDQLSQWQADLNQAWDAQKSRWNVKVEFAKPDELSSVSHAIGTHGTLGTGQERGTSSTQKLMDYLANNPEATSYSVRELERLTGVGKSTISRILKQSKGHRD